MNNLSDQLNFNSNDHHTSRNKRKKSQDAYDNDLVTHHLYKKRCNGISSAVHNELNYAHQDSLDTIDDVDMIDANQTNGDIHLPYSNPNILQHHSDGNNNNNHACHENPNLVQIKPHERHEVRSFCRPHWKEDLYQFGPFF